ncbi:MAG: 50S ribosomal protein L5 [Patescibacteria group bacterium]
MAIKHHELKTAVPAYREVEKIVVSVGVGTLRNLSQFDEKVLPEIERELAMITSQRASRRPAKQSISSFKTREGDIVGLQVTLRNIRLRDFFTKVLTVVLPRVRDFRGLDQKSVDEGGNLNIGFREQTVFPEIEIEKSRVMFGIQVTVVPRDRNRERAIAFYRSVGVPFKGLKSGERKPPTARNSIG